MAANSLLWQCLSFSQLTSEQLYELLQLRAEVFIVEQACVYQDLDGLDHEALHLLAYGNDRLLCYARLLAPGAKYAEPSVGRVITRADQRGTGLGRELLGAALQRCAACWPGQGIRISAQQYLEAFYSDFGFHTVSDPYLEDGILHVEMVITPGD